MQAPELTLHEGTHLMREAIKEADEGRHQWPSQLTLMRGAISGHHSSIHTRARAHMGVAIIAIIGNQFVVVDESGHQRQS